MKKTLFFCLIGIFLTSIFVSAQNEDSRTINYRGKRTELESKKSFFVEKAQFTDRGEFSSLGVFFSSQINPASLKRECFLINGQPLSERAVMRASKTARSVRIVFPKDFEINSLEIFGIESYDGKEVTKYSSGKMEKVEGISE